MSIVVENLTKTYGEQKAVNDISFKINTGEVVGFLGPNGAGKSDVRLDELSILNEQEDIKKKIGYLPENNPLYTDMAIVDYLRFCAEIQGVSKAEIPSRISDMIDMCGLERERHKKISELSKGYRQSQAEGKELLTVKIEAADADVKKALLGLASVETVEPVEGKAGFFSVRSKPEVSSRKEVFDLCVSKKWYLLEMTGHETKLEDVFRELTN